jgi:predicted enzyme related to lactoylglutathione lyase
MSQADLRGKFIWHELMTPNIQGAADFYARVFSWRNEASTVPGYTLCMSGRWGVAGLMRQPDAAQEQSTPPSWLVYIAAPDVDATAEAAQRLGGKLLKAPTDIPGMGRFAVLSDPQGATFAVFAPAMPTPEGAQAEPAGHFSWHQLATIDPQGALAFYAQLFGWTRGAAHEMGAGGRYQLIEHTGMPIGGMYVMQDPSKPPHWLSFVQVKSLDETLSAVKAHGGRVVLEPHAVPGGDRVATLLDPQGGAIALHERSAAAPQVGTTPPARTRRAARPRKSRATAAPVKRSVGRAASARKTPARKTPGKKAARGAAAPRTQTRAKRSTARTVPQVPARSSARKTAAKRRPARKQRATAPATRRSTVHKTAVNKRPGGRRPAGKAKTAGRRGRLRARRR